MPDDNMMQRRRFLQATGAATVAAGLAGCGGGGGGDATETETSGGGETETDSGGGGETETEPQGYQPPESYPYKANETAVEDAKQVMEDAGYGPDNKFDLDWLQYQSPAWEEMANTIRSRLEAAHINMNIGDADFGSLLESTESGSHQAYTLGWIADYPAPQNFLQLIDPENTVYDAENYTPNGARLFWSEDAEGDEEVRQYMTEQFDRIQNNPELTDEAQSIRDDATKKMERALWDSAAILPIYHRVDQLFWYDHVDYTPPGAMGPSRAKSNKVVNSLEGKDTLEGTSATFSSLDPTASGNTASGGKIMNMFDAPFNYVNGTTEVEPLLVDDYEVSDDLSQYEFTLKQGVQFHDGYGEVTADDMVYSIQRLVESSNSTNTYFPLSVLSISHEKKMVKKDDDGNVTDEVTVASDSTGDYPDYTPAGVVPGSTAVEKTGDYSFSLQLDGAFGYTLSVLAYSAFSAVPEGIVGDIEGYDGEMSWQEFSTNPVGCGPFVFENWESGNGGEFRTSAYDDYHGEQPSFSESYSEIITDPTASHNKFLNENADVSGIPTSKYDPNKVTIEETNDLGQDLGTYELSNGNTVNMSATASLNSFYVGFHMEKVPKPVRQAMAYIINREQFIESVFKGRGAGAFHLTPPGAFPGGGAGYDDNYQA